MDFTEAKNELYKLQSRLSAYEHAVALMYYDGATTAPKGTAENRAHSLGILTEEMYRISTSSETLELLEYLDKELNGENTGVSADATAAGSTVDPDDSTTAFAATVDPDELLRLKRMVYLMLNSLIHV